jgi:hypothetical protein
MASTTKISNARKFWGVLSDPEVVSINGGLLAIAAVCLFVMYATSGVFAIVAGFLLGAALVGEFFVLRHGMQTYDHYEAQLNQHKAAQWARAADTESERTSRMSSIDALGPMAAMAAVGLSIDSMGTPPFNVDGTPMMPGGFDIKGHVFGQTDAMEMTFDDGPTGADAFGGYEPPIGMDSHDMFNDHHTH